MVQNQSAGIRQTGTILDKIDDSKIEEVASLPPSLKLEGKVEPVRDFVQALRRDTVALIAEIKHASPSKGVLIDPFDPASLARTYARNGAAAMSVLTDHDFFQGRLDDMMIARANATIPILRKDFIIDERQIVEARKAGADAILLIVAILDDPRLADLFVMAHECGLTVRFEVHTEVEMARALKLSPPLIGINNRDLHTFKVDLNVTQRLARLATPDITLVAESGIFTVADVEFVAKEGVRAILVGESIVQSPDIAEQVRILSGVSLP